MADFSVQMNSEAPYCQSCHLARIYRPSRVTIWICIAKVAKLVELQRIDFPFLALKKGNLSTFAANLDIGNPWLLKNFKTKSKHMD